MAATTTKATSLEAGIGENEAGELQARTSSWRDFLWDELDTKQTTMQFGGYCLLTGTL